MYAHAVIEHPETGEKFQRGDQVPDDLPGYDELVDGGAIKDEEYTEPEPEAPASITVGDVTYVRADDQAGSEDNNASS